MDTVACFQNIVVDETHFFYSEERICFLFRSGLIVRSVLMVRPGLIVMPVLVLSALPNEARKESHLLSEQVRREVRYFLFAVQERNRVYRRREKKQKKQKKQEKQKKQKKTKRDSPHGP